ncbi:MarR family winged helix-turn-helix transcriptional regulator [Williamsia sp. 1135]|uniref:MarR family winged helix-turn-helix transcriptional regulator n=1 Tax=Williamsia sp. 1135 TaxID=1889262 RepID=UPI000A0F6A51|nr:MarR family winged helix-turn-helix transcriptional regulator [Williamsia sp. 1135]ORM30146.1 MarR family transcriptional regulator [Williamsia sp. 1135]
MTSDSAPNDIVERIGREWAEAYPDLDTTPVEVLGRINRIASALTHSLDRDLEAHSIGRSEFDVLGALARAQRPLRASEVVSTTMLSGASITKLTERLSEIGLVRRRRSDRDGRVVLLELTEAGRDLVDTQFPRRLARDTKILESLSPQERVALITLLRKVSQALPE